MMRIFQRLFLFHVLILISINAFSASFTVLDDFVAERSAGKPVAVTQNFTVKSTNTSYRLKIINGGISSDLNRFVTSAVILLNGNEIFSPNDFKKKTPYLSRDIAVNQYNELSVEVRGKVGSVLSILIEGDDNDLPLITAETYPDANSQGWHKTPATVSFTCSDETSEIISCTDPVIVSDGGMNIEVVGHAADQAGNTSEKSVFINLDQIKPIVEITPTPLPNINGWNNTDVNISYECFDNLSGVVLCPSNQTITADGLYDIEQHIIDNAGNESDVISTTVKIDKNSPTIQLDNIIDQQVFTELNVTLIGQVFEDNQIDSFSINGVSPTLDNMGKFNYPMLLVEGNNNILLQASDIAGNTSNTSFNVIYQVSSPDVGDSGISHTIEVPPLDTASPLTFSNNYSFIFQGDNPVQIGVNEGVIESNRLAILRGIVKDRNQNLMSDVNVSILNHEEYGQTHTRADGVFDMVVNGGEWVNIVYQKSGYLTVHRKVKTTWNKFHWADDVVMVPIDVNVKTINFANLNNMVMAQGSTMNDVDGERTARVLFPRDTTAEMIMPNGDTLPLSTINVRITEYTVGDSGPDAMPSPLPSGTGYTYAAEFSVDEAIAAGAKEVRFNQALPVYVDNFLGYPAGTEVPSFYFDRVASSWLSSPSGVVIKVLNNNDTGVQLDINGQGTPATSAELFELDISNEELTLIANTYVQDTSFWRVPVTHFTPYDFNWPSPPSPKSTPTINLGDIVSSTPNKSPSCVSGSIIECQNRVLRERVSIANSDYTLNYRSDTAKGFVGYKHIEFPVQLTINSDEGTNFFKTMYIDIVVAGRIIKKTINFEEYLDRLFSGEKYSFTWDGKDAYGRSVYGKHTANISITLVYEQIIEECGDICFTRRGDFQISFNKTLILDGLSLGTANFNGWTLSQVNTYDSKSKEMLLGDGQLHQASVIDNPLTIDTLYSETINVPMPIEGSGFIPSMFSGISNITYNAEGDLYFSLAYPGRIYKIHKNNTVELIAGNGTSTQYGTGDGGPAIEASFYQITEIDFDSKGNLYVADLSANKIRKIDTNGIISTFAGTGEQGYSGDGGLAINAMLFNPQYIAIDNEDNVIISDTQNSRLRKISPEGIIDTIAGGGSRPAFIHENGTKYLATDYGFHSGEIEIDNNNNLYFVADDQFMFRLTENGGLELIPDIIVPQHFDFDQENNLVWIRTQYSEETTRIAVTNLNTNETRYLTKEIRGFSGDGGLLSNALLYNPYNITVTPENDLVFSSYHNRRIGIIKSVWPNSGFGDSFIPSKDGTKIYQFNNGGKHSTTRDALTGVVLFKHNYDENGYLVELIDQHNNITTIERNGDTVTAIVSPDGLRTGINVNDQGLISSIVNPNSDSTEIEYQSGGLLTAFIDENGNRSEMEYDEQGFLVSDLASDGVGWTVDKLANGAITLTSSENRTKTFQQNGITISTDGIKVFGKKETTIAASGLKTITTTYDTGVIKTEHPDNTNIETVTSPDPRFGLLSPYVTQKTVVTPAGIEYGIVSERSIEYDTSVTSWAESKYVNGREFFQQYLNEDKSLTSTSPMGRQSTIALNDLSQVLSSQMFDYLSVNYAYDTRGRLTDSYQGTGDLTRQYSLSYNELGYINSTLDPLGRETTYDTDILGRVLRKSLPDGRQIDFTYDGNGNVTSITPPGREAHIFQYSASDLEVDYEPPTLATGATATSYLYNLDKQITRINRPSGDNVDFSYDYAGRLFSMTSALNSIDYVYNVDTGQVSSIVAQDNVINLSNDGFLDTGEEWLGNINGSVEKAYDNNFWVSDIAVNNQWINYAYDNDGLITNAGDLSIVRGPIDGFVYESTLDNTTSNIHYNDFAEMSHMTALTSGTVLYDVDYQRDVLGRITQKTETRNNTSNEYYYDYDISGRVVNVTKDGMSIAQYIYDDNGNRISGFDPLGTITANIDAQDRLLSYNNVGFSYDANGTLTAKTIGSQTTQFTYDAFSNLRNVTLADGTQIEYVIDGKNRRIGKKVNGNLVQGFLYQDQLNPIAELDVNSNVVAQFVYGTKSNVPDYMVKDGNTYRIFSDHLGSPILVVNAVTGEIAQELEYDTFGAITKDTSPGFQPFGFAGGIYDQHSKLTRFGARDYDATTARWTTKDPIRFQGGDTNLYGYVMGDPVNLIDLDGFQAAQCNAYSEYQGDPDLPLEGVCPECWLLPGLQGYKWGKIGKEFSFGKNLRVAPFGNRRGNPTGKFPHYHRRGIDKSMGEIIPGQGMKRHRPWDKKSTDKSFFDRF